jgi:CTP:molybdopterin cytidylyltransferase MocA
MRKIVYVVLAAGGARRMGFAKVTTPLAGSSPIARLGAILEGRAVAVVTAASQQEACAQALPGVPILVNPAPERGMTSSLLVAHDAVDPGATLGVLLADKPFVTKATLDRCEATLARCEYAVGAAPACDVLFATFEGEPGHPVYFTPAARTTLHKTPEGDTLRAVRDNPALRRVAVACDDDSGVVIDLDTPDAWNEAERRLIGSHAAARESHTHA